MKKRNEIILPYVKNKTVLDIGFLGDEKNKLYSPLHEFIIKHAKEVWGCDIDEKRIEKLKEQEYKVIFDDGQKLDNIKKLNLKFDVVILGETLGYFENPGLFFDNVKYLLKKDGILIITVPNVYALRYILRYILFGKESEINRYGQIYRFSKVSLYNLALRKEYKITSFHYSTKNEYKNFRSKIENFIGMIFPRLLPMLIIVLQYKGEKNG